jgi:hypothetical protein
MVTVFRTGRIGLRVANARKRSDLVLEVAGAATLFARGLEGWPRVHALHPSFETHRFAMLLRMRLRDARQAAGSSP